MRYPLVALSIVLLLAAAGCSQLRPRDRSLVGIKKNSVGPIKNGIAYDKTRIDAGGIEQLVVPTTAEVTVDPKAKHIGVVLIKKLEYHELPNGMKAEDFKSKGWFFDDTFEDFGINFTELMFDALLEGAFGEDETPSDPWEKSPAEERAEQRQKEADERREKRAADREQERLGEAAVRMQQFADQGGIIVPECAFKIKSLRKRLGLACKQDNGTLYLATHGEFTIPEGSAEVKLKITVPPNLPVRQEPMPTVILGQQVNWEYVPDVRAPEARPRPAGKSK